MFYTYNFYISPINSVKILIFHKCRTFSSLKFTIYFKNYFLFNTYSYLHNSQLFLITHSLNRTYSCLKVYNYFSNIFINTIMAYS